jgi:hypothetical protein
MTFCIFKGYLLETTTMPDRTLSTQDDDMRLEQDASCTFITLPRWPDVKFLG